MRFRSGSKGTPALRPAPKADNGKERVMSVHFYTRLSGPTELVDHPQLEPEVKRAILASWASDACSVRNHPGLRQPPELPGPVPVDDVLSALRSLDGDRGNPQRSNQAA